MGALASADALAAALFPRSRRSILGLLYSHPGDAFYLRQIVDLTGLAMGQTQRELKRLTACGILERRERGRHVYFRANDRCPIHAELRGIVARTMGAGAAIGRALEPLSSRIAVALVFGSIARGEENRASDLDLMVIGDASFAEVARAVRAAERELRRDVNLAVYPAREFGAKVQQGHSFLTRVIDGKKLFIIGDEDDLGALSAQPLDS